jgi:hypothetical protein
LQDTHRESKDIFLEPNHTHFVIVYNAESGEDLNFRCELEEELRKRYITMREYESDSTISIRSPLSSRASSDDSIEMNNRNISSRKSSFQNKNSIDENKNNIPMIHLYVHGGLEMLNTCKKALMNKVPILLFQGAKGCSDLIADLSSLTEYNDADLKSLIEESNILSKNKYQSQYSENFENVLKSIKFILEKKNGLINTFNLDDDSENSEDIAYMILKSFLDSQKNSSFDILRLALQWNRLDVVVKNDIFSSGSESLEPNQLEKLLEIALIEDKPEFVKLLLDNGTNLTSFLTYGRFYYLYNSREVLFKNHSFIKNMIIELY